MQTRTIHPLCSRRSAPWVAFVVLAACGDRGQEGTYYARPDTGVTMPAIPEMPESPGIVLDAGVAGSSSNGASDSGARVLDAMSGGSGTDAGSRLDAGSRSDAGSRLDAGATNDGGIAGGDAGALSACTTSAQCTGTSAICVSSMTLEPCLGCNDGHCASDCDPFSPTVSCAQGESCTFLGTASAVPSMGLCLAGGTGSGQGQPCVAAFDALGNYAGDSCNRYENFICLGAFPGAPNGVCARICRPAADRICGGLGNYACLEAAPSVGYCREPAPNVTDVGNMCPMAGAGQCQGLCAPALGNSCSTSCAGIGSCPMGTTCVGSPPQVPPICALECHLGTSGDAACSQRNPTTRCVDIGLRSPGVGVCAP